MDFTDKKILHLSLTKMPFDLMLHEWKLNEYRKPSDWIKSRLYHADGTLKEYDYIKFTNGYGLHMPFFYCEYLGFYPAEAPSIEEWYSIAFGVQFKVNVEENDLIIPVGKIVFKGNLKK